MKIIVPIKQVPETENVKMDPETGTMVRDGVEQVINPLDLYSIEEAIRIKENRGAEIIAISMGPPSAEKSVREAIAMGCDRGILLSHKSFSGSDTWATSYVLAQAIRQFDNVDLVLCGERATDGDTGQVGPGIASWLEIPFLTYISEIQKINSEKLTVQRNVETGHQILEIDRPCLLTVVKEINFPRLPTLQGKKESHNMDITKWEPEDINAKEENLGLEGSPTRVVDISKPKVTREGEFLNPESKQEIDQTVSRIINYLQEKEIV